MSSIRSASSSTTQRAWSRRTWRSPTRSVRRPGVAIRISTPRASWRIWAPRDMPPSTRAVVMRAPPASRLICCSICTASSRVGARSSARVVFGSARPESARMWCRIGRLNAAVLPVPVWAMPRMSRPSSCGPMACAWIGVGLLKSARISAAVSGAARPKSAKDVIVKTYPFRRSLRSGRRSRFCHKPSASGGDGSGATGRGVRALRYRCRATLARPGSLLAVICRKEGFLHQGLLPRGPY